MRHLGRMARQSLGGLWIHRSHTLLMISGLVIGICAVTVINEIGQGVEARVLGMMDNMGFGARALFVAPGGGQLGFGHRRSRELSLTLQDARAVARVSNVVMVGPMQSAGTRILSAGPRHTSTRVRGTDHEYASARNWELKLGRFHNAGEGRLKKRVVVLGSTTASELFGPRNPVGLTVRIGKIPFTVVGVLAEKGMSTRGHDRDDRAMVPLGTSISRLSGNDRIFGFRVNLLDSSLKRTTAEDIRLALRAKHGLEESRPDDFRIITPEALAEFITSQSRTMVTLLTFVSIVSLFVSGIVIMNIMLVAVNERAGEIGLRRAMGARRRDILWQFLLESLLVALLGGACGMALGLALSRLFTLGFDVPVAFSFHGFLLAFAFSAVVGLGFGLIPAQRAANLTPAEALR